MDIPTNKKDVAKIIYKTAKEAFRRGYRAWKTSKKQADRLKKKGYGETGVIPYGKEAIKKAIRSVKFQGRAAKLAKKQKKPAGSRARGISFVGRGYQGDRTKTMQVPMITKLQRRAIQKSISKSVKKFMKEKIGKKATGGAIVDPEGYNISRREMGILANVSDPKTRKRLREFLSSRRKHKPVHLDRILDINRGRRMSEKAKGGLMRTPKLAKRGF